MSKSKEQLYSERMSQCLLKLEPQASDALQIAARAQHIERWKILRDNYPENLSGYKKWRSDLAEFHAKRTAEILLSVGYDSETILHVQSLIKKERFKVNPEAQTLEDVICIVFLEYYFDEFSKKHTEDKLIGILQKTWKKMSDKAHTIVLSSELAKKELVQKALKQ